MFWLLRQQFNDSKRIFCMDQSQLARVNNFVNDKIESFHQNRISSIKVLKLRNILKKKNPYLFRAKNLTLAADLVTSILDASLSSSEETSFGRFLEQLAMFLN